MFPMEINTVMLSTEDSIFDNYFQLFVRSFMDNNWLKVWQKSQVCNTIDGSHLMNVFQQKKNLQYIIKF